MENTPSIKEKLFQREVPEKHSETVEISEREKLEIDVKTAIQESTEVRASVDLMKSGQIDGVDEETRITAEEATYFAQDNLDALNAATVEVNQTLHPEVATQEKVHQNKTESHEQKGESIWSLETETAMIESVEITAPKNFSEPIVQYLSSLQLPQRLYAGDRVAPIKPIDVFAVAAEKIGVKGKKINFTIGEVPFMDLSEDGEALNVCLSKFELTNPDTGLLGTLSLKTKNLLTNRGKIVMDKATRENIATQTTGHIFGRAKYGEALGYQIPPEHQKAYYRGIGYRSLNNVAEANGFVGGNSDSMLAMLKPTVWAYTDPGMAESFGGSGVGIVFKIGKRSVDKEFETKPGWQRWTVNEVMIQPKEGGEKEAKVMLEDHVDEILVFDEKGEKLATELFPNIPRANLRTIEDGSQYLADNDEITNEGLEQYYDDPNKITDYIGQMDENPIFALCQIEKNSTYEDCRKKMEDKVKEFRERIFSTVGLKDSKKIRGIPGVSSYKDIVRYISTDKFYALPSIVKKTIDKRPEAVNEVKELYQSLLKIEWILKSFDSYDDLRQAAEKFKQKEQG